MQDAVWVDCYRAPSERVWTGRIDADTPQRFHEMILCHDLSSAPLSLEKDPKVTYFALVGFACDEGVRRNLGREGASLGPEAFRRALAPLPLHRSCRAAVYDVGDIVCEDGDLERSQRALATTVSFLLQQGFFPLIIGGGHEVAWAHYQGLRTAFPSSQISVVNFDAHFDLRPLLTHEEKGFIGSSGTSFTQIASDCKERNLPFDYSCFGIQKTGNTDLLFEAAHQLDVSYLTAEEIYGYSEKAKAFAQGIARRAEKIYCSVCLDVFSSSVAPGVSAPQPLGLLPWHVLACMSELARSGKVIALDVAELNPKYDVDGRTAKLTAHLVSSFIAAVATDL